MAKITMTKPSSSGIALGGIGAGSVELLPDGEFHFWQIANQERLTTVCHERNADDGETSCGALSFWVRAQEEDKRPIVRKLGMRTEPDDFTYRLFAWNKPVERIEFDGRFPLCELEYIDHTLPCKVSLRATAPFVAHQSDIAATPGFYMDFTIENPTDKQLIVSMTGMLEPSFANEQGCVNTLVPMKEDGVGIFLDSSEKTDAPNCGNLCFSVSGAGEKSYITGEYWRFMREYIANSEFGVSQESFLFGFRKHGELPNSLVGVPPEPIPSELDLCDDKEIDRLFELYCAYPFVKSRLERICQVNTSFPTGRSDKTAFLEAICQAWNIKLSLYGSRALFGACALCGKETLLPGEKKTIRFILSWYFPNHFSKEGKRLGHYYENLFADSLEVNRFLLENYMYIHGKAEAFAELLYNTDLPSMYPDAWSGHVSTLVKNSWYLKDGKFGIWEGLGFCGFHTTDITYHASFGLLALFPDLQLKQMRMGAAFQRDDGRVHHFFTPDLEHVDDGFDRVDMNMQFVMMVLRDYLYTGDYEYLTDLWDNVKRAMDAIERIDMNFDGLPDHDTKHNTYDAWNFAGTPAYISILWLGALKAASVIAEKVGDSERNAHWSKLLKKGKISLEERLWNGSYYNLWSSENETDESLMADQLDGEWFLRAAGIGGNLSDERVRSVIETIFDYCFDPEAGLVNAVYPNKKKTTIHTYKNCQAEATWTGIGYIIAALCLYTGLRKNADTEMRSISDNQLRFGAFWDHWECGHHYTRPMSSWTTLNAALGLMVDREAKIIRLKPIADNITLPLCTCDLMATVHFQNRIPKLECIEGSLEGWTILNE